MAEKMNNLTGSEWLQESFTIWRGIKKTKEELKDLNVANLWVLFAVCLPLGLVFVFFWF